MSAPMSRPAWQTEDLMDEWPDDDERTQSIKQRTTSTQATNTQRINGSLNFTSMQQTESVRVGGTERVDVGTFVVREDEPHIQVMAQTPGKPKKGGMKTMFTPLAIEKMFEPPSPPELATPPAQVETGSPKHISPPLGLLAHNSTRPSIPSKLSQAFGASQSTTGSEAGENAGDGDVILETDMPNMGGFRGKKPGANCLFTFAVDHQAAPTFDGKLQALDQHPLAQSTPIPPSSSQQLSQPPIDPRLRLFQFQYDTYTRGHLSALVDSFAVSPQSGSSQSTGESTPLILPKHGSPDGSTQGGDESFSRFRSTKRIKLSPISQLDSGEAQRDGAIQKDYLGESRNLMQQIKRARDFSMVSAAEQLPGELSRIEETSVGDNEDQHLQPRNAKTFLCVPQERPPSSSSSSFSSSSNAKGSKYSSLAIRAQAEDLMTKIKHDMKSNRRLFSERTEKSVVSEVDLSISRSSGPTSEKLPVIRLPTRTNAIDYDKENNRAPPPYAPNGSHERPGYSPRRNGKQTSNPAEFSDKPSHAIQDQFRQEQGPIIMPVEIEVSNDLSKALSPVNDRVRSPNPAFLAPPKLTTTVSTNNDLNRFVSSSSTATGTTLNGGGSTGSFVKHAGAPHIVHIGPGDLPTIPDRVGKMVYDHDLMRWVKERQASHEAKMTGATRNNLEAASPSLAEGESDDPFRDIESLRDDDSSRRSLMHPPDVPQSPRSEASEDMVMDNESESDSSFGDAEEAHLSSFTFDDPASGVVQVMTGADEDDEIEIVADICQDDDTSDSDFDDLPPFDPNASELSDDMASMSLSQMQNGTLSISASFSPGRHGKSIAFDAQVIVTPKPSEKRPLHPPRSALKSASATPVSRIFGSGHRRSVSFSDGRKDGKILGLTNDASHVTPSASFMPSMRTKRITDMLMDIETSEFNSPSKRISNQQTVPVTQPILDDHSLRSLQRHESPSKRPFERSHSVRDIRTVSAISSPRRNPEGTTFLTDCSFGVAHDRLIQILTDVQPFDPYWEELNSVDLSHRRLDSVARLKEFLPKLDSLYLNENLLSWLSGIPAGVRTLSVASNALTSLTSFAHLPNLESVDISNNDIDSLESLRCLRHLRELRADGNRISSLSGLENLSGLVKLSLQGNGLVGIDASRCQWTRLEMLNLSCNKLSSVVGLGGLTALISLDLDNNNLTSLDLSTSSGTADRGGGKTQRGSSTLQKLRILRLSGNRVHYLNAGLFPNLRTLYLDNNCLAETKHEKQPRLINLHRLGKLENFSARNQSGGNGRDSGMHLQSVDIQDAKRLYLSGNPTPLPLGPSAQPCYNLVYLELAACRLTELPSNFSALSPNLRVLNLNYNFLEHADEVARSLAGLRRLRKLTLVGSRMTGTKPLIKMLGAMGENLELIDFRMNPCTLSWYLPLLVHDKDAPGAFLQPSEFTSASESGKTNGGSRQARGESARLNSHSQSRQTIGTASNAEIDVVAAGSRHEVSGGVDKRAPETSESSSASKDGPSRWEALDAEFRKGLPDASYVGRLAYRGLVMRACPNLRILDGVRVTEKERRKAEALLKRIIVDVTARAQVPAGTQ